MLHIYAYKQSNTLASSSVCSHCNKMITHYFVKCLVELLCVTLQINEQTNPYWKLINWKDYCWEKPTSKVWVNFEFGVLWVWCTGAHGYISILCDGVLLTNSVDVIGLNSDFHSVVYFINNVVRCFKPSLGHIFW